MNPIILGSMSTGTRPHGSRKQHAVDAAIEVIDAEGLRGLTHRAVDARAGLAPGSTSSCFRTRLALLSAVLNRLVELEEELLDELPFAAGPIDAPRLTDELTGLLVHWLGPGRARTRARLELYLDAARRNELGAEMERATRRFVTRTADALRAGGIAEPERTARMIIAQLDGLLYDALARPFLGGADKEYLRHAVRALVRAHLE